MKWIRQDVKQYLEAKEYIDTAVIPLLPLDISHEEEIFRTVVQNETIQIFATELEKEFSGRMMLFPAFVYMSNEVTDEWIRLEKWLQNAMQNGFKHIFLPTFDAAWRKHAKNIEGELVWLPCPTTMDMPKEEFGQSAKGLAREVMGLMKAAWA